MEYPFLAVGEFEGSSYEDVVENIHSQWGWDAPEGALDGFRILVAYDMQESYEGAGWFLLIRESDGQLFEVHGSHCSCMGFEGQFSPEETSLDYVFSSRFYLPYTYGDDDDLKTKVIQFVARLGLEDGPVTVPDPQVN